MSDYNFVEEHRKLSRADYTPKPVVETRHNRKTGVYKYNAEVSYRGVHYIVGQELLTREVAQSMAQAIVDKILGEFDRCAMRELLGYPIAKE